MVRGGSPTLAVQRFGRGPTTRIRRTEGFIVINDFSAIRTIRYFRIARRQCEADASDPAPMRVCGMGGAIALGDCEGPKHFGA